MLVDAKNDGFSSVIHSVCKLEDMRTDKILGFRWGFGLFFNLGLFNFWVVELLFINNYICMNVFHLKIFTGIFIVVTLECCFRIVGPELLECYFLLFMVNSKYSNNCSKYRKCALYGNNCRLTFFAVLIYNIINIIFHNYENACYFWYYIIKMLFLTKVTW